ncbi:MAG: aminopeptidase P family protein [Thermoleophilia bacterium]|nr:aminopeptidase P family protein [Thermoleophilia bacterium]
MPDVLIHGDTIRSPEQRHEVPVAVPDPFLYVERNGARHVVVSALEVERIREADPGLEVHAMEEFGIDELLASGMHRDHAELEVWTRACGELGVSEAVAPFAFPIGLGQKLWQSGVQVVADPDLFKQRRRVKTEAELAGIRRAQSACEAAMSVAKGMLGEGVTSEEVRAAVERVFTDHGAVADEIIVSHGPQSAVGHEMGSGPFADGDPVVIDLFPRDRASGCYADMTRTFVVGEPPDELRAWHALCGEGLDRALHAIRPGITGAELHRLVCELFHEHGHPTQLSKEPGEVLVDGFFHSLGHGVGLEVHEAPSLGRSGEELVAGDVVAVEPGLYRSGYGGCRLEDLVLVTEDGCENLTDFPYELT